MGDKKPKSETVIILAIPILTISVPVAIRYLGSSTRYIVFIVFGALVSFVLIYLITRILERNEGKWSKINDRQRDFKQTMWGLKNEMSLLTTKLDANEKFNKLSEHIHYIHGLHDNGQKRHTPRRHKIIKKKKTLIGKK